MRPTLLLLLLAAVLGAAEEPRPNLIIINIDDLGYADIGPFGSKLNRTPNLDRMAKEGMRLTSFYAAPVCSPSRAMLMTGCYPKRVLPTPHVLFPMAEVGLNPEETTIAETLKAAGYVTACVGKWHLGDQAAFLPGAQGFDFSFGIPYSNDMGTAAEGSKSDLGKPTPKDGPVPANGKMNPPETGLRGNAQPPLPMLRDGKAVARIRQAEQQRLVADYTQEAEGFIRRSKDRPFFLYLPHSSVHFPLYPGEAWAGKSPHGLYADWVEETDWSVGRILDTLRELGLDRRTRSCSPRTTEGRPAAAMHRSRVTREAPGKVACALPPSPGGRDASPPGRATQPLRACSTFIRLSLNSPARNCLTENSTGSTSLLCCSGSTAPRAMRSSFTTAA